MSLLAFFLSRVVLYPVDLDSILGTGKILIDRKFISRIDLSSSWMFLEGLDFSTCE